MHRRKFMKVVSSLCKTVPFWALSPAAFGQSTPNGNRKILVVYAAGGGLDPYSWCNPNNDTKFGRYGDTDVSGPTDGRIVCAPMGKNLEFFGKHADKTLIINGLNMQNSDHDGGGIAIGGRRGYPHICELYAACLAKSSMPWITNNGHGRTVEVGSRAQIPKPDAFNKLFSTTDGISTDAANMVMSARIDRVKAIRSSLDFQNNILLPAQQRFVEEFMDVSGVGLAATLIANNIDREVEDVEVAMLAAKMGFTNSIEVGSERFAGNGFDTHYNHVERMNKIALPYMTKRIDKIWSLAEGYGIADRLVVYVISEMGRKKFDEDDGDGKSHHGIGCATIMSNDINGTRKGGRVLGASGRNCGEIPIDFVRGHPIESTNKNYDSLTIPVLMKSLRRYLGIHEHPLCKKFSLEDQKDLDITNPGLVTGYPAYIDRMNNGRNNRTAGFTYSES